ncbi:MAG: hypothetical protein LAT75_08485 [Candidatus Cyclonatronum sp.]|uniref:hypothetical protein n=1 Tax=Cyclonatronum sp. TaxID=3024185 RepID=UPI0025BBE8B1|nr:hypothetical protein [Cyclonatronum sp.]MCC5933749.1 hypothetical protein [Balneolales bacterium]MCH8486889.1 hypothetical protein [Cyclonatronum sp.]
MAIVKEPKGIDFIVKSEPWTDEELKEFRQIMAKQKAELGEKQRAKIAGNLKKSLNNLPNGAGNYGK